MLGSLKPESTLLNCEQSQDRLYSYNSTALAIPTQAYADLLKASWILIDIISKHPQQRFWSHTGEYLQVQLLVEVIFLLFYSLFG